MAQQQLDRANVGARFQQMNCKCMPKRMRCDWFGNPANSMRLLARVPHRLPSDVTLDSIAREEPLLGLVHWPPATQDLEQLWRKHDVAIFLPLALFDSNDHSLAVDIGHFQADSLGDAQPGSVANRQDRAMLEALYAA